MDGGRKEDGRMDGSWMVVWGGGLCRAWNNLLQGYSWDLGQPEVFEGMDKVTFWIQGLGFFDFERQ